MGDWSGTMGQKFNRMGLRTRRYWAPNALAQESAYKKKHYDPKTGKLIEGKTAWDADSMVNNTSHAAFTLNQIESAFFELYKTLQTSQNFGNVHAFETRVKQWVTVIKQKIETYKKYEPTNADIKIKNGHYYGKVFTLLDYLMKNTINSVLSTHVAPIFGISDERPAPQGAAVTAPNDGRPSGPHVTTVRSAALAPKSPAGAPAAAPAAPDSDERLRAALAAKRVAKRLAQNALAKDTGFPPGPPGAAPGAAHAPPAPFPAPPKPDVPQVIGGFVMLPKAGGGKSRRRRR